MTGCGNVLPPRTHSIHCQRCSVNLVGIRSTPWWLHEYAVFLLQYAGHSKFYERHNCVRSFSSIRILKLNTYYCVFDSFHKAISKRSSGFEQHKIRFLANFICFNLHLRNFGTFHQFFAGFRLNLLKKNVYNRQRIALLRCMCQAHTLCVVLTIQDTSTHCSG